METIILFNICNDFPLLWKQQWTTIQSGIRLQRLYTSFDNDTLHLLFPDGRVCIISLQKDSNKQPSNGE